MEKVKTKQDFYNDILGKIISQNENQIIKKDLKNIDFSEFNDDQLFYLRDFYDNYDKIDLEIKRRSEVKNADLFQNRIKKMTLQELTQEKKLRKILIGRFDNLFVFDDTITDKEEKDYWIASKEMDLIDKQMTILQKRRVL